MPLVQTILDEIRILVTLIELAPLDLAIEWRRLYDVSLLRNGGTKLNDEICGGGSVNMELLEFLLIHGT